MASTRRAGQIATAVLAKAALLDPRMPHSDHLVLEAWAQCFHGQPVWLDEAVRAVIEHYRDPNPTRLMPGDVLARTRAMPIGPDSSGERLHDYLDWLHAHPFSPAVRDLGMRISAVGVENEARLIREFISGNRDELITAIRTGSAPKELTA